MKRTKRARCTKCRQLVPSYDIVNLVSAENGCRSVCSRCSNTEAAEAIGLSRFEHVTFEPVKLADCTGELHEFHFQVNLFGPGVALNSFELRYGQPAGYQFQIIGDPEEDLMVLLGRLIEKMRRGLSIKHLEKGPMGLQIADHAVLRGKIEWDGSQDGSVPLLNIDGRNISWQEAGRMLMTFEGSQFKLEIRDKSEEL